MRVGICGSQGTGKTTMAKILVETLGLPQIKEQARSVASDMGFTSEEMLRMAHPDKQREFQRKCLQQQQRAETENYGGFVSDRTVVDNAAYWLTWNHAHANVYERYAYVKRCKEHAKTYDLIVYCPPIGSEPEDDGFRIPNPVYQQEIDLLIRTLLVGWDLRFVRVEGSPEERAEQVCAALEEMTTTRRR